MNKDPIEEIPRGSSDFADLITRCAKGFGT